jgi:hypothetical protein
LGQKKKERRGLRQGVCTTHEVDPGANAHLLALLHLLECFVEEDFAGEGIVDNFDVAVS